MLPSKKFKFALPVGRVRFIVVAAVVLILFAASGLTFAQDAGTSFSVLNQIDKGFAAKTTSWSSIITVYAQRLFWMLATVDFCYLCVTFVLDKKEMDDMLASVIRKVMTLGFFWFILKTSNDWIPQILQTFTNIGQQAGQASATTPDGIASAGYNAALGAFQALKDLGVFEQIGAVFPAVLMALIIFLSFLWVAAQLLVAKIETSIAVGAGIILLGFGGSKWTTDMASKYMQYSVATGLKLMLMYLLVGAGEHLFNDIHIVSGDKFFESLLVTAGTALTYGFLATKIPAIASAMMSGSPSLTAGDMTGAIIGAGAAMAGLGAAAMATGKGGAGAAAGGAAAATGVGQALSAGLQSGLDHGKSGAGLAAHAIGEAGKHGMGMAKAGVGDMLKGAAGSFGQKVEQSTGGRIASSINASRGGSMGGVASPSGGAANGAAPSPGAAKSSGATSAGPSSGAPPDRSASGSSSGASGSTAASPDAGSASNSEPVGMNAGSASPTGAPTQAAEANGPAADGAPSIPASSGDNGVGAGGAESAGASSESPESGQATRTSAKTASSSSSGPTAGASAPPKLSALAGAGGDASTGAVSGGGDTSKNSGDSGDGRKRPPLHERMRDMKGYVPDDAAHSATLHIDLKHAE